MTDDIMNTEISLLYEGKPYLSGFFMSIGLKTVDSAKTPAQLFASLDDTELEKSSYRKRDLATRFEAYMTEMKKIKAGDDFKVDSITIIGGVNKSGAKEDFNITMRPGDIICIVGPTGSGKSRLLADIECLAQGDTPTKRRVLINNMLPDVGKRFSISGKLVAQLSQNMNFIMDLTVREFETIHARTRLIAQPEKVADSVETIIEEANKLAGEKFGGDVSVTQLSGGQSRALMIADTAFLSASPVILIDEIENAGIDRKKALSILVKREKIVLMATHDPILTLMGDKRLIIENGGVSKLIKTSSAEKESLVGLEQIDNRLLQLRENLRHGRMVEFNMREFFSI